MGILDGKVAIVTGSGHDIGRGEALELAAQGAKVVINDVGGSARGEGTDRSAADEMVEVISWRDRFKAGENVRAAVVNTVSSAGLQGNVGQANYGSAKAGIAALTIITPLEGARYGVRANAVAPGGVTRLTGAVVKDAELKEPDAYTDDAFSRLNPQNSAPMVAWLASDEALHVTGQVFRAVGANIAHYEPWRLGTSVDNPRGDAKWDPAEISAEVNAHVFHSRHPGLKLVNS